MTLTPLFFPLNTVSSAILPVQRRQPQFFFQLNAANSAIFHIMRR